MNLAVVIPVGPGRRENLAMALGHLAVQTSPPSIVVLVADGPEAHLAPPPEEIDLPFSLSIVNTPKKHEPGMEQPRNIGVRVVEQASDATHVWFLDSDIIVEEDCAEKYAQAMSLEPELRVLIGPYDWLPPGERAIHSDLKNDPRWVSFDESYPWQVKREDLSAGLACFSGNLVWPISEFKRTGGYWSEIHHGRCEDGELGLRAVAMGVPISFVPEARGWHLYHEFSLEWRQQANARDVPMLNARHPWVEGEGLFVVEEDGKRFNCRCQICGEEMNSALIWAHQETCEG